MANRCEPPVNTDALDELAGVGRWQWDPQADTMWWSTGLARLLALAPDTVPSSADLIAAIDPRDRAEMERALADVRVGGTAFKVRHRVGLRGKRTLVTHGQVDHESGQIIGLCQDITDLVGREAALLRQTAINEAIVRHAGIAIVVSDLDTKAIQSANPALCAMLGYEEAELQGKPWCVLTHPDDPSVAGGSQPPISRSNATPNIVEKRYLHKDGSVVWGRLTATRAEGRDGEPLVSVALIENIDDRRRTIDLLQAREREMRSVIDAAGDAVFVIDTDNFVQLVNPAGVAMFGYAPEKLLGESFAGLFDEAMADAIPALLWATGRTHELKGRRQDGSEFPIHLSSQAMGSDARARTVVFVRDITDVRAREIELMAERDRIEAQASELAAMTEQSYAVALQLEAANDELTRLATTDSLTGVYNRRMVIERGLEEVQRVRRYGRPMGVLALDIDHFKQVNDKYGHAGGDEALITVAQVCEKNLRAVDTFGRLGGEEFAVLLPETDVDGAMVVAEKIRALLEATIIHYRDETFGVTTSIGVSVVTTDAPDLEAGLDHADKALYAAKNAGRNQVRFEPSETPIMFVNKKPA